MDKKKGFSLTWVLIIVTITSIISALTTGVILFNNHKITDQLSYDTLSKDEDLNQFLEVYANISNEYYQDLDKKAMLERAISAMMDYIGDDYTDYLNKETTADLMEQLKGKYKGIGISISNKTNEVTNVFDDSPAQKAGILVGDKIIGINTQDVTNATAYDIVNVIKKISGAFTLKIDRKGNIINVTLKSEEIISPSISYKVLDETKTGYLKINTFSATLGTQVTNALKKLEAEGMNSLIIDIRDNTGGYLNAAVDVISKFLEKDKIIYELNSKEKTETFKDQTTEKRNYPIVLLVNGYTASASEILAAALKESYGATIVGEKTFGKGKVQQTLNLNDGTMVKYTSAYWLTPNGVCIDEVGITPDYIIENENIINENNEIIEVRDMQLEKAQDILREITNE